MDVNLELNSNRPQHPRNVSSEGYLEGIGTREEWATVYYALEEYKQKLLKTIEDSQGSVTQHEDEKFCYGTLATVSGIQFDILENHEFDDRKKIRSWMDVK